MIILLLFSLEQDVENMINTNENMEFSMKVCFFCLDLLAFFGILCNIFIANNFITELQTAQRLIKTFPSLDLVETETVEAQTVTLEMLDDLPPAYDDLVVVEDKEELGNNSSNPPSYEVACEKENKIHL